MNHEQIEESLDNAVHEAFIEMLPKTPINKISETCSKTTIADAAIVALSGTLCGSLIVLTPRESTVALARKLAGLLINEDNGSMAENGLLTQLEQDSIRELSNRVGCIFTGNVNARNICKIDPTFPIFICGQDINIIAESDIRLRFIYKVDENINIEARIFLSPPQQSKTREEKIKEIECLRDELLASEK
ncbi:MAG: hypothetical protein JW841_13745 [Deltaproteobacteria bacterium]|nr:hypothetical protein [Deltaproteobacteria bacterium]